MEICFSFQHIYTSLAEIQIQQEEEIAKSPISVKEPPIILTATEILYQVIVYFGILKIYSSHCSNKYNED